MGWFTGLTNQDAVNKMSWEIRTESYFRFSGWCRGSDLPCAGGEAVQSCRYWQQENSGSFSMENKINGKITQGQRLCQKKTFCYFWFCIFQHKKTPKMNSPGKQWLDCSIPSVGHRSVQVSQFMKSLQGWWQLISFPLNTPGCILLLSLHLKHLQMHGWLRKLWGRWTHFTQTSGSSEDGSLWAQEQISSTRKASPPLERDAFISWLCSAGHSHFKQPRKSQKDKELPATGSQLVFDTQSM